MEREDHSAVSGSYPGRSARPLAAIQLHVGRAELRLFERSAEGERLARIAADQELMLKLSVEGFDGETWREVADALVAYGHTVMLAWISSGVVFRKCRERGLGGDTLRIPAGGIPPQEAEELALDTVGEAIVYFRDGVLAARVWDPARGASMTTFFVGACLLRFPNEFRRWRRCWNRRLAQHPVEDALADEVFPAPDDEVLERESFRELLAGFNHRTAEVAYLRMQGFSTIEIAEVLGASPKSVEMVLYRLRERLRRERARVSRNETVTALMERSSLGTEAAKRLRARSDPRTRARVLDRVFETCARDLASRVTRTCQTTFSAGAVVALDRRRIGHVDRRTVAD